MLPLEVQLVLKWEDLPSEPNDDPKRRRRTKIKYVPRFFNLCSHNPGEAHPRNPLLGGSRWRGKEVNSQERQSRNTEGSGLPHWEKR